MVTLMKQQKVWGKKKCNWCAKRGDNIESCNSQSRKGRKRGENKQRRNAISKC